MNVTEIADELNAKTDHEVARMNQTLNSKCYDADNYSLTTAQENAADDLADEINNLNQNDLDILNGQVSAKRKLSTRPC